MKFPDWDVEPVRKNCILYQKIHSILLEDPSKNFLKTHKKYIYNGIVLCLNKNFCMCCSDNCLELIKSMYEMESYFTEINYFVSAVLSIVHVLHLILLCLFNHYCYYLHLLN